MTIERNIFIWSINLIGKDMDNFKNKQQIEIIDNSYRLNIPWSDIYTFTKHLKSDIYKVDIYGTLPVTDEKMYQLSLFVDSYINCLKYSNDRMKFVGHILCLIGSLDPSLGVYGSKPGQRNGGGKNKTLLDVDMINHYVEVNNGVSFFRGWDIPIHEMAHSTEFKLGLVIASDTIFMSNIKRYNFSLSREYFPWAVQKWFNSFNRFKITRSDMVDWEYNYISEIFNSNVLLLR